jgi:hypothetical protein
MRTITSAVVFAVAIIACEPGGQVVDLSFDPQVEHPAYEPRSGPLVMVDEAHFNIHTIGGRFAPFAKLLRRDGYRVIPLEVPFSKDSLRGEILVIANALHERNRLRVHPDETDWTLPNPSAFASEEIVAVRDWVRDGGSLLLIADHMPCPGAAAELAAAFGFQFTNGFTLDQEREKELGDTEKAVRDVTIFRRSDGTVVDHAVTNGRDETERVDTVVTFTGQAFQAGEDAEPLLVLRSAMVSLMPETAWEFTPDTKRIPVGGWLQGAVLRHGEGRVAVFGEAAMFTAQLAGKKRRPMGMNAPAARENQRFVLNLLHWLSGEVQN